MTIMGKRLPLWMYILQMAKKDVYLTTRKDDFYSWQIQSSFLISEAKKNQKKIIFKE